MSISQVNAVFGWVCKCQYASAICRNRNTISKSTFESQKFELKRQKEIRKVLTASGSIFPPSPKSHSFVLGISMTPSITACAICTPFGPNSLARLCAIALRANFIVAKAAKFAEPFTEAVAPVKMRLGGWGEVLVEARRRGRVAWAKLKEPLLCGGGGSAKYLSQA